MPNSIGSIGRIVLTGTLVQSYVMVLSTFGHLSKGVAGLKTLRCFRTHPRKLSSRPRRQPQQRHRWPPLAHRVPRQIAAGL